MKQTAVEWLFEQIINRTDRMYFLKEFDQAKEMEKQQVKDAYTLGRTGGTIKDFNETFKSE